MQVLRHTRTCAMDEVQVERDNTQAEQEETDHVQAEDEIRSSDEQATNTTKKMYCRLKETGRRIIKRLAKSKKTLTLMFLRIPKLSEESLALVQSTDQLDSLHDTERYLSVGDENETRTERNVIGQEKTTPAEK